jgi:hypothetical protein
MFVVESYAAVRRVPSRDVLEMAVAVSGGVTVSRQAARSIMLLAGGCPRLCQPSTLRMLI